MKVLWSSERVNVSERALTASVMRYVRLVHQLTHGKVYMRRVNNIPVPAPGGGFRRGSVEPGEADLQGNAYGVPLALEIKSASGKQSRGQREWAARWRDSGGLYFVVRSLEDAAAAVSLAMERAALRGASGVDLRAAMLGKKEVL